ncbi:MAG: thioredoxin fold domain-containing protein [Chromatiales bacterium]|jgi:thioredoxin-related protein
MQAFKLLATVCRWQRRYAVLLFVLCIQTTLSAASIQVPPVSDLTELSQQARQQRLPILLVVTQDHCPFCMLLKSDVIKPMLISGDYDNRVIIAELAYDTMQSIINFRGEKVLPGAVAADYKVWVAPTLLFLDADGVEVHKRMLGVNTIEMYGYYLDEALAAALKAVRAGPPYDYQPSKKDIGL